MSTSAFRRPAFGGGRTEGMPWRQRSDIAPLALGLAASSLLSVGCMQILGLEERTAAVQAADGGTSLPTMTANGSCGGLVHATASCAACMDQSCCNDARACAGDPACQEAQACLAACGDDACRSRCATFYTLPDSLMSLRRCRVDNCAAACGSRCGEMGASPIPACDACLQATCCAEATACATNTRCAALKLCHANCFATTTCPSDCDAQFPDGAADFDALFRCADQCASVCLPGQDWSCLGRPIVWPKPKGVGMIQFSVTFVDFADERPFVGTTVKLCNKLDLLCTNPGQTAITDMQGRVTFTVQVGVVGFDGYLDVSGGKIDNMGDGAYPSIWYPLPFVVADGWRGRTTIPSELELLVLSAATGSVLDKSRAHFAANAADCNFSPASGVSFVADTADSATQIFYLENGSPSTSAMATDTDAIGGFINLPTLNPAKLVNIKAISTAADNKQVGSLSLIFRPNTLTTMSSFPPIP